MDAAAEGLRHTVTSSAEGVMIYSRHEGSGEPCLCCDGGLHVFAREVEVVGTQAFSLPCTVGSYPADMTDWLSRQYNSIPDGARVRVTMEIIDSNP